MLTDKKKNYFKEISKSYCENPDTPIWTLYIIDLAKFFIAYAIQN